MYKSTPAKRKPARQLAGPVHEPVRYHSLSGTISFRLQACHGLLPARPGYMACWVESLCMLVKKNDVLRVKKVGMHL